MNRRFFCSSIPAPGDTVELADHEAHHVRTVLRASGGEALTLLDGEGLLAEAELLPAAGNRRRAPVVCRILAHQHSPAPPRQPWLCVAPPRPKQMSLLVRQATELGVRVIQPILCTFSTAKPDAGAVDGWREDAREACKQSANPWLPRVEPPRPFAEALAGMPAPGYLGWVPAGGTAGTAPPPPADGPCPLWIGPEGGFANDEVEALLAAGCQPLQLGPYILRVETAVVAGLTWIAGREGS